MKNPKLLMPGLVYAGLLALLVSCNNTGTTHNQETDIETETRAAGDDPEQAGVSQEDMLKKGEHLVMSIGCDDCHTPKKYANGIPEPDMDKHLMGHPEGAKLPAYDMATVKAGWTLGNEHFTAWVGAWGTSFSANLTPDKATGLGTWTEENFFTSIREGKFHGAKDGRPILPPMPWPAYSNLTDEELRAMFAYLKSIKPIKNAVPAPLPPKDAKK
ncbi:MAG TPA: c-type cytochrome [Adhaeribacter sp.]|nr:c-type cytochrome [Adhaeribacter sp.]